MKTNLKIFVIILSYFIIIHTAYSQATRGTHSGELYIPSTWYYLGGQNNFRAIFYTENHGELLSIKYTENVGFSEMAIGKLISDATDGIVYNNNSDGLWISHDFAETWEFIEDEGIDRRYSSGTIEGEIYKYCTNQTSFFFLSNDYGQNFEITNTEVWGFPEVGTNEGEVYVFKISTFPTFDIYLLYSGNYSVSFDTIDIEPEISGWQVSSNFPKISRGSNTGELYLVTWFSPANFHIYYSDDYGNNFDLKYISEECNFYFENYRFTAGKETGEFYIVKEIPWFDGVNTKLTIYHSSDTANTFEEYVHILDEDFPVNVENISAKNDKISCSNFPNPFQDKTTFIINAPKEKKIKLNFYNSSGVLIEQIYLGDRRKYVWDLSFKKDFHITEGLYFYNIESEEFKSELYKLLLIKNQTR